MKIEELKVTLRDPTATPDSLAAAADQARDLAVTCGDTIARLSADRQRQLLDVSDEELERLDGAIAAERRTHDRAAALAEALEVRKGEVEAALAEAARQAEIRAAHEKVAAFEAAARKLWPGIVTSVRKLIELEAGAQVACMKANLHAEERIEAGAFRRRDSTTPPTVLDEEIMTVWTRDDGSPVPLADQDRITPHGDGSIGHELNRPNTIVSAEQYHRAQFVRVRFSDAVLAAGAKSLATTIALPALMAGDRLGWNPAEGGHPGSIAGVLETLREPVMRASRPVREELVSVDRYKRWLQVNGLAGSTLASAKTAA